MPPRPRIIRFSFSSHPRGVFERPHGAQRRVEIAVEPGQKKVITLGRNRTANDVHVPFLRPQSQRDRGVPEFVSRAHGFLEVDNTGDEVKMRFKDISRYGTGLGRIEPETGARSAILEKSKRSKIQSGDHLIFGINLGEHITDPTKRPVGRVFEEYSSHEGHIESGWHLKGPAPEHKRIFLPHVEVTVHDGE